MACVSILQKCSMKGWEYMRVCIFIQLGKKTLILLCNILHYFHNECGRIQLNVKTFEISCSEALYFCFSLQE